MKKIALLIALLALTHSKSEANNFDPYCPTYAYNPSYALDDACGFVGSLEYLYWRADFQLDYATELTIFNSGSTDSLSSAGSGSNKQLRYDFDSGFRVGVGYVLPCDYWQIKLDYTHIQSDIQKNDSGIINSRTGLGTEVELALGLTQTTGSSSRNSNGTGTKINCYAKYNFDELDLLLSREFFVGPHLSINPNFGLKCLFINHRIEDKLTNSGSNIIISLLGQSVTIRDTFTGVGATGNLKTMWDLFCNGGLIADFGVSVLISRIEVFTNQSSSSSGGVSNFSRALNSNQSSFSTLDAHYDYLTYTLDSCLGFCWTDRVFNDQGILSAKLAWEGHFISEVSKIPLNNSSVIPTQPMTLHGLVFGICIEI